MQTNKIVVSPTLIWYDVINPTKKDLTKLARDLQMHPAYVQDCLDPKHLPKFESYGDTIFLILRSYDDSCNTDSDSVQELTRKVALFIKKDMVLTIHRVDQPYLRRLREKWTKVVDESSSPQAIVTSESPPTPIVVSNGKLVSSIIRETLETYDEPLERGFDEMDTLEIELFRKDSKRDIVGDLYYFKRTATVLKRILRLTLETLPRLQAMDAESAPHIQDVRDEISRIYFNSDQLLEFANDLMNLSLSIETRRMNDASFRLNNVMRVLTVFSIFFLPLNFIAGVYGMNFEHMPELKWQWGYPFALSVMVFVSVSLYAFFRRSGLIGKDDSSLLKATQPEPDSIAESR